MSELGRKTVGEGGVRVRVRVGAFSGRGAATSPPSKNISVRGINLLEEVLLSQYNNKVYSELVLRFRQRRPSVTAHVV